MKAEVWRVKMKRIIFLFFILFPIYSRGELLRTLRGHEGSVNSVFVSGDYIVSGSGDKTIRVWRLSTGELLRTLRGHENWVNSVFVSGDYIVSGSGDSTIRVWRLSTGELLRTLRGHEDSVWSVFLSGDYIVSGSGGQCSESGGGLICMEGADKTIRVWRLSTGELLRTLRGHEDWVRSVFLSGDYIVSGSDDETIRVWRLSTGELLRTLRGHENWVRSVFLSGDYIVSGSSDKTIRVWRLSTGELLRTLRGHEGSVFSVFLSGDYIVSGSKDNTIRVWRLSTGELLRTLRGHEDWVNSVFVSGDYIVSGSVDNTIRVWLSPEAEERRRKEEKYKSSFNALSFSISPSTLSLYAGENASGKITIKNKSDVQFQELILHPSIKPPSPRISLSFNKSLSLNPSQEVEIPVSISTDWRTKAGKYELIFSLSEPQFNLTKELAVELDIKVHPPSFSITGLIIDDTPSGRTWGDGDGKIERGERGRIEVEILNNGEGGALSTEAHLLTSHPHINIIEGKVSPGDIEPHGRRKLEFVVDVSRDYNGPSRLPLSLVLTGDSGRVELPLVVSLKRSNLWWVLSLIGGAGILAGVFLLVLKMIGVQRGKEKKEISLKKEERRVEERYVPSMPTVVRKTVPSVLIGGKYELLRQIGEGGMGKVYEAMNVKIGKRVAIKKMREELSIIPREKERFMREARLSARLNHPNIVEIFDIIEDGSDIYLVYEFVDGKTLEEILYERGRLPLKDAVSVIRQVCDALIYAHNERIIHRDLKPSNIMITKGGIVKVMDFGIAREAKDTISRLSGRDTSGTWAYMAPEQHLGQWDERSDIYSLGCIMYEMLAGEPVFRGPDFLAQKERKAYRSVKEILPEIPDKVENAIRKCLEPQREKRYQSVEELKMALLI